MPAALHIHLSLPFVASPANSLRVSDIAEPALVVGAGIMAWLVAVAVGWAVSRRLTRSPAPVWPSLRRRCRLPFRTTLVVAAVLIALPEPEPNDQMIQVIQHALAIALIGAASWLVIQLSGVVQDVFLTRINIDVSDNRRARKVRTQLLLFRRLAIAILVFVAIGASLMTFPQVRALGASLLVSAGVLSVVVGLAAQTTLGNLIAGLQIAFTDPIRIDDVVVVNEEWGRIDEITLTYVVVRTWDNRRLILPVSWFTTNVFQNWTRHEARVLGSIILHLDFTVPVDELRAEMHRVVQHSPLWDGRDWVLQVVDTTPTTMVLRGLVSAADAPSNWDLCCEVREKLIEFIQEHHPRTLPTVRADIWQVNGLTRTERDTASQAARREG